MAFVQSFGVKRSPISYFYNVDEDTTVKPKVRVDPNSDKKGHDIINQNNNLALYGAYSGSGKTLNEVAARDSMAPSRNFSTSNGSPLNKSWYSWGMDRFQDVLSVAGMIPGLGAIPDALNTTISGGRAAYNQWAGDDEARDEALANMAFNAAAIIPGAGQAATAAKWARAGINANKATKVAKVLSKGAQGTGIGSKILKGGIGLDKKLGSMKLMKGVQNVGIDTASGKASERLIKQGGKKAFNFAFNKKGIVPKALMKKPDNLNSLKGTAYLAAKGLDKSTSAVGLAKFGKMGVLGDEPQRIVKSTYNDKYKKKEKNQFGEVPRGPMISNPPKKTFKDAYENADKSKYKTFDAFKTAAVTYNKNKTQVA